MMATTVSPPSRASTTSAFTAPLVTFLTVPASTLRALIFIRNTSCEITAQQFYHNRLVEKCRGIANVLTFDSDGFVLLRGTAPSPGLTVSGHTVFERWSSMDSEKVLPEFIQKRKERRRRSELSSAERGSPPLKSASISRPQRTEFWKQLLRELDFIGSISPFGEEIVRVSLHDDSIPPLSTRTDLILDGDLIRCSVLNGGIYYLNFTVLSDTKVVVQDIQRNSGSMDARKTAEYVVDRMLNILEWTRR